MLEDGFFLFKMGTKGLNEVLKVGDNESFCNFGDKNKSLSVVKSLNIMKNTYIDIVALRVKRVH